MSLHLSCKVLPGISILALFAFAAEDPFAGTWKMNAAESKLEGSGITPGSTVTIEPAGNGYTVTVDGTSQGQPMHFTYTLTLDGQPAHVSGAPGIDEISTQRVDTHTITATGQKDGKTVFTDRRVVSSDGKTMTITRRGTNLEGEPFEATMVFDKQ